MTARYDAPMRSIVHTSRYPHLLATGVFLLTLASSWSQTAADHRSVFDSVTKHLDQGGQLFGYLNVSGDYAAVTAKVNELYNELTNIPGGPPIPPGLDIEGMLLELGLENVSGIGASSIKVDAGYRNRVFIGVNGERKGLLRLTGDEPAAFTIQDFAIKDAVLAFETHLRTDVLKEIAKSITARLVPTLGMDPMDHILSQPVEGTSLTVDDVLTKLTGHVYGYVSLDREKMLEFRGEGPEVPGIDVVLAHDSGKWLYDMAKEFFSNVAPESMAEETEGSVSRITITFPGEGEDLGFYEPVLQLEGDRLIIASRKEALAQQAGGDKLKQNADYAKYAAALPQKGNALTFISKELLSEVYGIIDQAVQAGEEEARIIKVLVQEIYGDPQTIVSVVENKSDGVYSEMYGPQSYKTAVLMLPAFSGAFVSGFMSAVSAPMMIR